MSFKEMFARLNAMQASLMTPILFAKLAMFPIATTVIRLGSIVQSAMIITSFKEIFAKLHATLDILITPILFVKLVLIPTVITVIHLV